MHISEFFFFKCFIILSAIIFILILYFISYYVSNQNKKIIKRNKLEIYTLENIKCLKTFNFYRNEYREFEEEILYFIKDEQFIMDKYINFLNNKNIKKIHFQKDSYSFYLYNHYHLSKYDILKIYHYKNTSIQKYNKIS